MVLCWLLPGYSLHFAQCRVNTNSLTSGRRGLPEESQRLANTIGQQPGGAKEGRKAGRRTDVHSPGHKVCPCFTTQFVFCFANLACIKEYSPQLFIRGAEPSRASSCMIAQRERDLMICTVLLKQFFLKEYCTFKIFDLSCCRVR